MPLDRGLVSGFFRNNLLSRGHLTLAVTDMLGMNLDGGKAEWDITGWPGSFGLCWLGGNPGGLCIALLESRRQSKKEPTKKSPSVRRCYVCVTVQNILHKCRYPTTYAQSTYH